MAIVRLLPDKDPKELAEGQVVLADSDAPSDAAAIWEIERYCREQDPPLWRADELHLSTVFFEGRLLRRGRCYRPYADELRQRAESSAEIDRRVSAQPLTTSSVELTREG